MQANKRVIVEIMQGNEPLITIWSAANRRHFGPPISDDEDTVQETRVPKDSVPPKPKIDWDTFHERNGISPQSERPFNLEVVKQRAEKRKAEA